MNQLKVFWIILTAFSLSGCKDDIKKSEIIVEKKSESQSLTPKNTFVVELNTQFSKDDILEVFFLQNESQVYNANQMARKEISGSEEFQTVEWQLPQNDYPSQLRLDFGFNKQQSSIKIASCILKYNTKSFEIKGKDLPKYFNFNDGISMQSDSLTFHLKPFMLNDKESYDPYITGNEQLETVLMTKL